MSLYNADGQIALTVVNGSSYTGLYAADGSYNIVINASSTYVGLHHACGALNAFVTTNPSAGHYAPNGSIYVMSNNFGGYSPVIPRGNGASGGATINIPDTGSFPTNQYSSGQYLAVQTVNDLVSSRTQSMTINTSSFPNNTVFNSTWPVGADNSVKAWNAVDFGDYLQTVTPTGVTSARIADITSLVSNHNFSYSDNTSGQGANVAIDGFLYRTPDSFTANMICEWQVYFHLPTATKTFIDAQPSVGTYVSSIIGSTPSITWTVTRQTSNTQGVPYYLAYPTDTLDRTNIQFDILAFFNYLRTSGYLTGFEYFNGCAMGMEPLKNVSALTLNSWSISPYTVTAVQDNIVVPWQTNLVPTSDFTDATWEKEGVTGLVTGFTETAGFSNHRVFRNANPITVSASKQYTFQVDVDITSAQPIIQLQMFRQDYGAGAQAYFDPSHLLYFQSTASTFTNVTGSVLQLTNGKVRLSLTFTTDVSTTGIKPFIASAVFDSSTSFYNISYSGNVSKTLSITNPYLFDPAELSPYFALEVRKSRVYQDNASALGAFANGDVVGKFSDLTSAGVSPASVANNTTRPLLQGIGAKPYLLFDGVDDILNTGTMPGGSGTGMGNKGVASTLVVVYRAVSPATGAALAGMSVTSGTANLWYVKTHQTTASTASFRIVDNAGFNVLIQDTITAANVFDGNDHVLIVTDSGTNITFYLDGVQVATQAYTQNSTFISNRFNIGALQRATTIAFMGHRHYACAGFPGVLSAPDIARVNTYYAALK